MTLFSLFEESGMTNQARLVAYYLGVINPGPLLLS